MLWKQKKMHSKVSLNKIFDITAFLPPKIDFFVATLETRNSLEIFGLELILQYSKELELEESRLDHIPTFLGHPVLPSIARK